MDALRRVLSMESMRQEIIAAELAKQRKLESKARHELALVCATSLLHIHAGLHPIAFPHNGTKPVPQGVLHIVPLLPELGLQEAMATSAGASMSRLSVKDRIGEWYRPLWHDRSADEEGTSHTPLDGVSSCSIYSHFQFRPFDIYTF